MALLTINDQRVISAEITMPAKGVWRGTANVDGKIESGSCTIKCGSVTLLGTTKRVTDFVSRTEIEFVGGKGKFGSYLEAQEFKAPSINLVLQSTLGEESLSSTADSAYIARSIPRWIRLQGLRSAALDSIVKANGGTWRVLDDGTVWIGEETWPDGVTVDYLESDAGEKLVFSQDAPTARPGTKIRSKQITSVQFSFSSAGFRTTCEYGSINLGDNLSKMVKALAPLDWYALYPASVVSQSGDAVDVKPDRQDLPSMSGVPIRHGVPGLQVKIPSGTKVLLGFEAGDPQKPFVGLWSFGTTNEITETSEKIELVASTSIKLSSNDVSVGNGASAKLGDVEGLITAINSLVSSINANVIAYNACVPVIGVPLGSSSPQLPLVPIVSAAYVSTKAKVAL